MLHSLAFESQDNIFPHCCQGQGESCYPITLLARSVFSTDKRGVFLKKNLHITYRSECACLVHVSMLN